MTQRTSTEIAAELAAFRAARAALIKGERVTDVANGDGRMSLASMSLGDITDAIRELETEYNRAVQAEASRPVRRAIGHTF